MSMPFYVPPEQFLGKHVREIGVAWALKQINKTAG